MNTLGSIFDINESVVLGVDSNTGDIIYANPKASEFYGYTIEELLQQNISDIAAHSPEETRKHVKLISENKSPSIFVQHRLKDGSLRDVHAYTSMIIVDNKKVNLAIIYDITIQKQLEENLRYSEHNLKQAEVQGKFGYWKFYLKTNQFEFSDGACEIYGISDKLIDGDRIRKCRADKVPNLLDEKITSFYKNGGEIDFEYPIRRESDQKLVHLFLKAKFDVTKEFAFGYVQDISLLKISDEKLKESESNLKQAELQGKFGYWKYVVNEKMLRLSDGACEIYGIDEPYITMERIMKCSVDREAINLIEKKINLLKKGEMIELDYPIRREKDQRTVYLHLVLKFELSSDYIFGSIQDVTEKVVNQKALKLSEERFKRLINEMSVGVTVHNTQSKIIMNNPMACEFLGLTKDQLNGKTSLDPDWNVIHEDGTDFPGDTHPVFKAFQEKKNIQNVIMGVYHPLKKERVWLLVSAIPELDPEGNVEEVIVTFMDITEKKKKDEAIIRSEYLLNKAQEISLMGNFEWNFITQKSYWSDEMYRIFQIPKTTDQIDVNEILQSRIYKEDLWKVEHSMRETMENGESSTVEYRIQMPDGTIKYVINRYDEVIRDEQGNPFKIFCTCQDITKQKNYEAEIEKLNRELKALSTHLQLIRTQERNKLAIEVHDKIGQGMTALRYQVNHLEKHLQDPNIDIPLNLHSISETLFTLIQSFKEIYIEVNPTLLDHLDLSDAIDLLILNFKKKNDNITLKYFTNAEKKEIALRFKLILYKSLEQALSNISKHSQATQASVSLQIEKQRISLIIDDNGCGFDMQQIDSLIQFGILEIRENVQSAGGHFGIQSTMGKGTAIDISLPLQ